MTNKQTLTGLWLHIPNGADHYHIGEVVLSIGKYHLIKIHPPNGPPWSRIMMSKELCDDEIFIFDSEEAMNAWMKFLETPDDGRPKVVNLRKD
jgi:hypothetical protein